VEQEPVEIFRVGPLDDGGSLYVPVSRGHALEGTSGMTDVEGIRQIIEQWPEGSYLCSPDLADAAAELGLSTGSLRSDTEGTRISIALSVAMDPDFDGVRDPWAVLILMTGARDFLRGAGVERWPAKLSMAIELRGDRQAKWYGAKLSAPYPGIVLFQEADHAKKCALLAPDAQIAFCAEHPHLRVQLEPGPEFATKWIQAFYGIERMPRLLKQAREPMLADDEDALVVGGVLTALAQVENANTTAYSTTQTPNREVRTFIDPGSPWPFVDLDV
jgi:hypothetical protein